MEALAPTLFREGNATKVEPNHASHHIPAEVERQRSQSTVKIVTMPRKLGYHVELAASGEEAIEALCKSALI